MELLKVIFITYFGKTTYEKNQRIYFPGTDEFFLYGVGQFIAAEFIKRGYNIQFHNWRMDKRITHEQERVLSGINCRIFPSKVFPFIGEFSFSLLHAIIMEQKTRDTVFHFFAYHLLSFQIYAFLSRRASTVATHLGGPNPLWMYQKSRKLKWWLLYEMERYFWLQNFGVFITLSMTEISYLRRVRQNAVHMPVFGIPRLDALNIIDKAQCRNKLGLPVDKKIILQVGRATSYRGFNWIMELLDALPVDSDLLPIFIGVNESDEYYKDLKARELTVVGYIDVESLACYYNAADILIYLPNDELMLNFAGTSYVPLESLICGTPVIATTLHHFPDDRIFTVSKSPRNSQEVMPLISELLKQDIDREQCRRIVLDSFAWDKIIEQYELLYASSKKNS